MAGRVGLADRGKGEWERRKDGTEGALSVVRSAGEIANGRAEVEWGSDHACPVE